MISIPDSTSIAASRSRGPFQFAGLRLLNHPVVLCQMLFIPSHRPPIILSPAFNNQLPAPVKMPPILLPNPPKKPSIPPQAVRAPESTVCQALDIPAGTVWVKKFVNGPVNQRPTLPKNPCIPPHAPLEFRSTVCQALSSFS